MSPRYAKATNKDIENPKYRQTGTGRGCAGTNNPGGTQKPDNPLKAIRNPIPQKPDNLIKAIRGLVQNGTHIQWPRGLIVPT